MSPIISFCRVQITSVKFSLGIWNFSNENSSLIFFLLVIENLQNFIKYYTQIKGLISHTMSTILDH